MWNILLNAVLGLIGIGIMIFIHEGGHYVVARSCGITVEVFSFGMGPKLFSWKRGHTEFRISLLPVGGFCRMKGADDLTRALEAKNKSFIHTEAGSLFAASPGKRFLTYLAGPLSNIIFAIIVYTFFSMMSYSTMSDPARIVVTSDYPTVFSLPEENAAHLHGLRTGDTVLELDGEPVQDYQRLVERLRESQGDASLFTVLRDGGIYSFPVTPLPEDSDRYIFGIASYIEPVVATVTPDSPEEKAGLLEGDRIVRTQDGDVSHMLDLLAALSTSPGRQTYTVARDTPDGDPASLITLDFVPVAGNNGEAQLSFSLVSGSRSVEGKSLGGAFTSALSQSLGMVGNTLSSLGKLITGKGNIRDNFTGPWRASMLIGGITAQGFRESFTSGLRAMLYLLGVVSVSLAVANILPIPALDGGFMLICIAEMVLGRQLSPKTYMRVQIVGMVCIVAIIVIMSLADLRFYLDSLR